MSARQKIAKYKHLNIPPNFYILILNEEVGGM
jgi:hypothetical protein